MKATYWILWIALPMSAIGIGLSLGNAIAQTEKENRFVNNFAARQSLNSDAEIEELVAKLRSMGPGSDPNAKSELRDRITELTRNQFLEHESTRERQVQAMEERVAKLKRTLELRAKNMDQIIEARVDNLLGETSALEWDFKVSTSIPELENERDLARIDANFPERAASFEAYRSSGLAKLQSDSAALLSEKANSIAEKTRGKARDAGSQMELMRLRNQVDQLSRALKENLRQREQKLEEMHSLELELAPLKSLEHGDDVIDPTDVTVPTDVTEPVDVFVPVDVTEPDGIFVPADRTDQEVP